MTGDVETAASDVILPAQESAESMAVQCGENTVNVHLIGNTYILV